MLLVLDNYDSFTYNLVQYLEELGAETKTFRNDELTVDEAVALAPERVVISPGPATPEQAGISLALVERLSGSLPILGVCLGHQVIAQVFGAKIIETRNLMHGKMSKIIHKRLGIFKNFKSNFLATRYHSLIIDRKKLPKCLIITAETKNKTIMGIMHKNYNIHGVQFHPESINTKEGMKLIKSFLNYK